MEIKKQIVIFSHLSDLPYETDAHNRMVRCEFIKYLLLNGKDLDADIDPDLLYLSFAESSSLFTKARVRNTASFLSDESGENIPVDPHTLLTVLHQDDGDEEFGVTVLVNGKKHRVNSIDLEFV